MHATVLRKNLFCFFFSFFFFAVKFHSDAEIAARPRPPRSAPRVRAMLEAVVLELDLIFDLVDQYLRQEDADELRGGKKNKQIRRP